MPLKRQRANRRRDLVEAAEHYQREQEAVGDAMRARLDRQFAEYVGLKIRMGTYDAWDAYMQRVHHEHSAGK